MALFEKRLRFPALLLVPFVFLSACGSNSDMAEEHRKLSLRIEHLPPVRTPAGEEAELRALIQSSLEGPRLEAWVRIEEPDGSETMIPFEIAADGSAVAKLEARPRGHLLRYAIEARDAAGLVVTLPRKAEDGNVYTLRYEGPSSRILGGISFLSAFFATVLFLGAGAAAVQNLRGRMSAGPAGMLGGFASALVVFGLLAIGGIHAFQVTGWPWPSSPVFLSLNRFDLGIVALVWVGILVLGRRVLLDEDPNGKPQGERGFAIAATAAAGLLILFTLF